MQVLSQENQYLLYAPLCEGESNLCPSWDKESLRYAMNHKKQLLKYIESSCNSKPTKNKLSKDDYDDIYEELIIFLYKHKDYSEELAYNKERKSFVDLKSYIEIMAGYMCQTYIQNDKKTNSNRVDHIQQVGDEEVNILDNTKDESKEINISKFLSLDKILEQNLCNRYYNNVDIYLVWYIRITTENDDTYNKVLGILNINKNNIKSKKRVETKLSELMKSIAKAVSLEGTESAKETLKKYVYSYDDIDRLIANLS